MALKLKQKETPEVNDAESEDETEESNGNGLKNQALDMFTDARLLKETYESLKQEQIEFLGKWGMDGAGEQQTTRQSWSLEEHCDNSDPSDKSVFITCFIPLRLRAGTNILWLNSKPNSVIYSRPISFQFIKETVSVITINYKYYNKMLEKIENYCLEFHNMNFNIKFNMKCSILYGKEGNAITGQVCSASCNICRAESNEINDIDLVLKHKCKTEFYKFGFPILHS